MRPVTGPFVVHADKHLLEVVARGAGPAGAIGVELFGGEVSLDLDGADVNQLVAVRFPLTGGVSSVQRSFIKAFFGDAGDDVLTAISTPGAARVGARRRAAFSTDTVEVDPTLSLLVVGADTLNRIVSAPAIEALLALEVLTASSECGLVIDQAFRTHCEAMLVFLPRVFPVPGLDPSYQASLSRAVSAGVLPGLPAAKAESPLTPAIQTSLSPIGEFAAYARTVTTPGEALSVPVATRVTLDPLSLLLDDVTWLWVGESTLRVIAPPTPANEVLWVRVRSRDGTVLSASPLLGRDSLRREANLLVVPREDLILDVVASVTARVLGDRVVAIARAVESGQRAGRLERLGALDDAAIAWEECAAWHRVVGDSPREKLAMVRASSPSSSSPSLLDALLENRQDRFQI
jgi:hypothetical protein